MARPTPSQALDLSALRFSAWAWCWAIYPTHGDPEGLTSWSSDLVLPAYQLPPGDDGSFDTIPAMTYRCRAGLSPTSIPTRLHLGQDGADVAFLAFDRARIEAGFYDGARFDVFKVWPRTDKSFADVRLSGELGNALLTTSTATVALKPWTDRMNRPTGRTCGAMCDVGRVPGLSSEEFGAGRCRGLDNTGPLKADWTVVSAVVSVTDRMVFRAELGTQALSGGAVPSGFVEHLENGVIEFAGGALDGIKRGIKWATTPATGVVELELQSALPQMPPIGATVRVTVGCRRTVADCTFFGNLLNYQGFPQVPGRAGIIRRFTG